MSAPPVLHSAHMLGSMEMFPVLRLAQPPPLTGRLARLLASLLGAVPVVVRVYEDQEQTRLYSTGTCVADVRVAK